MTTPHPRLPYQPDVRDPDGYLAHQLMLVRTGRRSRAAGIRRCTDCHEPFIDDHTGLTWCPTCRTAHHRRCADCGQSFPNTPAGDRLCDCCRDQFALFLPVPEPGIDGGDHR